MKCGLGLVSVVKYWFVSFHGYLLNHVDFEGVCMSMILFITPEHMPENHQHCMRPDFFLHQTLQIDAERHMCEGR